MKSILLKWMNQRQLQNTLELATFDTTPTYTLKGLKCKCKPLKVYDGDTLWIAIFRESKIYKFRVRMFGYDSAEMHSDPKAEEAKQYLQKLISDQVLFDVEFFDYDKYGRPLVKLYNTQGCINDQIVQKGLGKVYYGQTKEKW